MNQKLSEIFAAAKKYLSDGLVKDLRENWRIILVAAIVIAVFVNSWGSGPKPQTESPSQPVQNAETKQTPSADGQPENNPNIAQAKEESNNPSDDAIKEIAQKSEGVTHLARKAVKEYLASAGETLSPEQKIYAEDYLKRQIGSQPLEIGQTIAFKIDMIKSGVEKAKALNEKQIENLSKFVPLVKNL